MIDGMGRGGPLWGLRPPETSARPAQPADRGGVERTAAQRANGSRTPVVRELAASPPVDAARVAALRAEVAAGRFRTDPLAIADAMMALEPRRP